MNKRTTIILFLTWSLMIFTDSAMYGQRSSGGIPRSTQRNLAELQSAVAVDPPDMQPIMREDLDSPGPYRYAVHLPLDLTPDNSGSWVTPADGTRIWRLALQAKGALALSLCFDRFHIPEGGELFLYNVNKQQVIGAFNSSNNSPSGYFATELLQGDLITLEYSQPSSSTGSVALHLSRLVYAYRGVGFLEGSKTPSGTAGPCEVNVNCPEGQSWQFQKKGVVRISVVKNGSSVWCSGSLINNVRQDHTPYILTADHCGKDATTQELLQWVFYFDYEAPGCQAPPAPPVPKTLTGALRIAESGNSAYKGSDFYLVVINEPIPSNYEVFYNGWNRQNIPSHSGVGIHHPQGDIKKISTYRKMLETSSYGSNPDMSFWKVFWDETDSGHGVTEGGSSGSPIFDSLGRIVGTLTGGESNCDTAHINLPDYYGKIYWSWDLNDGDSTHRLREWLDPDSTGVKFLDGLLVFVPEKGMRPKIRLYPNPFHDQITLDLSSQEIPFVRIEVYNFLGDMILQEQKLLYGHTAATLNLNGISPGIYLLKVWRGDEVLCYKIIKQ